MDSESYQIKLESTYLTSNTDYREDFFGEEEDDLLQIAEDNYQGDYLPQKIDFKEDDELLTDFIRLMSVNSAYMVYIERLIKKVTNELEINQKAQKTIEASLNDKNVPLSVVKRSSLALLPFLPPYFKDQFGMIPSWNIDSHILSKLYPVDPLMTAQQKWNPEDRELLVNAVNKSLREILISPLMTKISLVTHKLRASGVDTSDEQRKSWMSEIEKIRRRISYLKSLSDIEVLLQIGDKDVDWERISAVEFEGNRSALQLRAKWCNDASLIFYQSEWRIKEDDFLRELMDNLDTNPQVNWNDVAAALGTSRAPFHCFERFLLLQRQHGVKGMWSADEDKKLISLVEENTLRGTINWSKVCALLPKRTREQCQWHYKRCLKVSHLRGRWTLEEDLELFKIIDKYGPQDWQGISSHLNKRSSLQCRDRWMNVLDPKRRNEPWLWEEHKRLFFGIEIFGKNSPAKIALLLPGRNNSDVKARINALKRFKMMVFEAKEDNRDEPTYEVAAANYKFNKARRDKIAKKTVDDEDLLIIKNRLGLGSYLITSSGTQADYSEVKLTRNSVFGRSLGHSGRWIQLRKNPNEYGSQELDAALKELPEKHCKRVLKFLNHSNARYAKELNEEKACGDNLDKQVEFYNSIITDARLKELKRQIERLLPIGKSDVVRRAERRRNYFKLGEITVRLEDEDILHKKTKRGRPRKRLKWFKDYPYSRIVKY